MSDGVTERAESLSSRIAGLSESLECGDGGVRGDFRAALAEVDALAADCRRGVANAREDMARHLRELAASPDWKPEVRVALEYAAGTFSGGSR
jgi:hypothetical protein